MLYRTVVAFKSTINRIVSSCSRHRGGAVQVQSERSESSSGGRVQEAAVPVLADIPRLPGARQRVFATPVREPGEARVAEQRDDRDASCFDSEEPSESHSQAERVADAAAVLRDDVQAQKVATGLQEDAERGEKIAEEHHRRRSELLVAPFARDSNAERLHQVFRVSRVSILTFELFRVISLYL